MKITPFDDYYPARAGVGGAVAVYSSGSNNASGDTSSGGDVVGDPGAYSVAGLRSMVSLASNIGGGTVGDVLTIIQTSPRLAAFATPSNTGSVGSNAVTRTLGGQETIVTHAASGATLTLDLGGGNVFDVTLTADCTIAFANAPSGVSAGITIFLRQNATGGWTTTWPGSVVWPGGTAPTLDETASTTEVLTFFTLDGGTVWYGFTSGGGDTSPLTTKGDLYTFSTAAARLAVGSNGTALLADSDQPTGLRWSLTAPVGELLITDTPAGSPLVFADLVQNEAQDDLVYADL